MKILIILSLAAICLAKPVKNDKKSFHFPGQPRSSNASHTLVWSEFGNLGSLNPERGRSNEKSSEESGMVLSNPHRRDVKLGFQGAPNQAKSYISSVLEKEKSSSSEESHAVDEQQEKSSSSSSQLSSKSESSSEEINTAAANPDVSSSEENIEDSSSEEITALVAEGTESSSEEDNALAVNQENSSSEENNGLVAEGIESSSEETNAPNANQEAPKKVGRFVKDGFQLSANALSRKNRIRDVDIQRPKSAKRVRSAEFDIVLNNEGSEKIQEPQGGVAKKQNKRVQRPLKQ